MMSNIPDNKKALWSTIVEVLFVFLPFIILSIVYMNQGKFSEIFSISEWSFASSILAGQTIIKITHGFSRQKMLRFHIFLGILAMILIFILLPSMTILILILTSSPVSNGLLLAQLILFIISLLTFIIVGGAAQAYSR